MNLTTNHSKVRRFLKLAKRALSLVLMIFDVIERFLKLIR